jgi:hypothetical protein
MLQEQPSQVSRFFLHATHSAQGHRSTDKSLLGSAPAGFQIAGKLGSGELRTVSLKPQATRNQVRQSTLGGTGIALLKASVNRQRACGVTTQTQ